MKPSHACFRTRTPASSCPHPSPVMFATKTCKNLTPNDMRRGPVSLLKMFVPVLQRVWHPRRTQPTHVRFEYSSLPWTWCVSPRSSEKWRTLTNDVMHLYLHVYLLTSPSIHAKTSLNMSIIGGIYDHKFLSCRRTSVVPKCQKCQRLTNTAVNWVGATSGKVKR